VDAKEQRREAAKTTRKKKFSKSQTRAIFDPHGFGSQGITNPFGQGIGIGQTSYGSAPQAPQVRTPTAPPPEQSA
jgi:hypothetical protein